MNFRTLKYITLSVITKTIFDGDGNFYAYVIIMDEVTYLQKINMICRDSSFLSSGTKRYTLRHLMKIKQIFNGYNAIKTYNDISTMNVFSKARHELGIK
jgi:hypothetical protein